MGRTTHEHAERAPGDSTVSDAAEKGFMDKGNGTGNHHAFLKSIDVIAFDCDGVLFDSREANVLFYNHILDKIGLQAEVQLEQRQYVHMHPVRESLRYLTGGGEAFRAAWAYVQTMDIWPFNRHLRQEPGLLTILELAKSCYHTALATNRTVSTHEVLAHFQLDQYFDLVVSASDVQHPKPHPEIMERICESFEVDPAQVLYVGDSPVDEAFASATGVVFAAYKNPELKAHLHIGHFDELHALLCRETENGVSRGGKPCGRR
jgi:phosphoglycolate phosphatase